MASERGSDRVAVSMLRQMFPKVFGDVYESHIRCWRERAQPQAVVVGSPVTAAALADMVQTIRAHVDACLEFTTSELRPVILAMLEERHPMLLTSGFFACSSGRALKT